MTKKTKIIIGVVGGVILLGGIGSRAQKNKKGFTSSPGSYSYSYLTNTSDQASDNEIHYDTNSSTDSNSYIIDNSVQNTASGNVSVRIVDWRFGTYEKEDDVLIIEYEWTNNSDEAKSFLFSIRDKVYQNGVECRTLYGYQEIDSSKRNNKIQPGVTYTLEEAYHLQDKSAASITLTNLYGSEVYLQETLDLGGGDGISSVDKNAETTIEILDIYLSEDYKGDDIMVVDFKFTNGEDKPTSFLYLFSVEAYQHGVECDDTVIGCDDIDGSRALNDVQPGVTYTASMGFHISDRSDLQLVVTEFLGDKVYYNANVDFPKED